MDWTWLRQRALHITLAIVLIVAGGFTAFPRALIADLGAALTAMGSGEPEAALPAFERALSREASLRSLHGAAAHAALQLDDYPAAMGHLAALPRLEDNDCEWLELLIGLEAWESVERRISSGCPQAIDRLDQTAELALADGNFQRAQHLTRLVTEARPSSAAAQLRLGLLLSLQDPEAAESHLLLARDLGASGSSLAVELLRTVEQAREQADPSYTLAQVGQTLSRASLWDLAAEAFRSALAIRPDYTEARAFLGLALEESDQDGLQHMLRAAQEAPHAALPQLLLAQHWQRQGDVDSSIVAYERASRLAPKDPFILADLGAAYGRAGDLIAAKESYLGAVEMDPDDGRLWEQLALFSLGHEIELMELGLPAARRAVTLSPSNGGALNLLGYSHYLMGNWELATRFLRQAADRLPSDPSPQYNLGLLALAQGDLAAGRRHFETALALDPGGQIGDLAQRSLENLSG